MGLIQIWQLRKGREKKVELQGNYEDSSKLCRQTTEWGAPGSTSPRPTCELGCNCSEQLVCKLSAPYFKCLLSASAFLLMALEILSIEVVQKCGRIYDLGGGDSIKQKRMGVGGWLAQPPVIWRNKSKAYTICLRVPNEKEPQLWMVIIRSIAHPSLASSPSLAFLNCTLLLLWHPLK